MSDSIKDARSIIRSHFAQTGDRPVGEISSYSDLKQKIEKLKEDNKYDIKTGLYNVRFFEEKMTELESKPHSLLLVDMDGLKIANDKTGSHQFGDKMLSLIANEMQTLVKEGDFCCRIGGDEFAIIFPNSLTNSELKKIANRLNNEVGRHTYQIPNPKDSSIRIPFVLSVSIGGAISDGSLSRQELFEKADDALYAAKNSGRSTAVVAE